MLPGQFPGLLGPAPGEQGGEEDGYGVPVHGGTPAHAFGEPQPGPGQFLGLHEPPAPVADVGPQAVGEGQVRPAPAVPLELGGARLEQLLGTSGPVGVHVGHRDQDRDLEAAVLVGPAEGPLQHPSGVVQHHVDRLAPQAGVPGAQPDDVPLGEVAPGQPVGEAGEPAGAGRGVGLGGIEGVPHELLGLQAQPGAYVLGVRDLPRQ